jgi:hypothetical protein
MLKMLEYIPSHKNHAIQEVVDLADRVKSQKLSATICKTTVRNDGIGKENTIMLQNKFRLTKVGKFTILTYFITKTNLNNDGSESPKAQVSNNIASRGLDDSLDSR